MKSDCNFPRPAFRFCHDQSQPPSIPASPLDHRPANHLCHDQSQPPSIPASPLDHRPANRLCHDQSRPPSIPASPLDHRPPRLITALRIVSATIGASSCRSRPRNSISRCPLVSRNCASGFISPVSALVEAARGSNARSVLYLASELHLQQAMTSVDRQERGQWTPDTSHLASGRVVN